MGPHPKCLMSLKRGKCGVSHAGRTPCKHAEERSLGQILPHSPEKVLDFQLQNCGTTPECCLSHLVCGTFYNSPIKLQYPQPDLQGHGSALINRVVSEQKCPAAKKPKVGWGRKRPVKSTCQPVEERVKNTR